MKGMSKKTESAILLLVVGGLFASTFVFITGL